MCTECFYHDGELHPVKLVYDRPNRDVENSKHAHRETNHVLCYVLWQRLLIPRYFMIFSEKKTRYNNHASNEIERVHMSLASRIDLNFVILAPTANHMHYTCTFCTLCCCCAVKSDFLDCCQQAHWLDASIANTMRRIEYLNFALCNLKAINAIHFSYCIHFSETPRRKGKTRECARNRRFTASLRGT